MQRIAEVDFPGIDDKTRDTMAIPSFLHPNPIIRHMVWQRYERIARYAHFRSRETIIEFGCGAGFFLPEIHSHGCRVTAVDLHPQFARELASLEKLSIETTDSLERIPAGSVNTIIAAEVMEHLQSPARYLQDFKRLLTPGGKLIISLPTENLLYKAGKIIAGFHKKEDYHISRLKSIVQQATETGFTIMHHSTIPNLVVALYKVYVFSVQQGVEK